MKSSNRLAADMIALYFAGKIKTQQQLREAITALANSTLFPGMTAADFEEIARHNEETQGFAMF